MLLNRTKKTETPTQVVDLTSRLAKLRADIETTRRELITARESADAKNMAAILDGGDFDPMLQSKAESLSVRLGQLESELRPLAAADQQQRAEAARRQAQAEAERLAGITARYREAVGALIRSQLTTIDASDKCKLILKELPFGSVKELGLPVSSIPEGIAAWKWAVCQNGFTEFLPVDDPGKALFDHNTAHEAAAKERFNRQQEFNRKNSGAIVEDDQELVNPDAPHQSRVPRLGKPRAIAA